MPPFLRLLVVLLVAAAGVGTAFAAPASAATPKPVAQLDSSVDLRTQSSRRHTIFRRLAVRPVRAGSRIRVSCRGRGCPFKLKTRKVRATARSYSLTSLVRGAKLRPRALLEIRITKPRTIGTVVRFRIRSAASPQRSVLCQAPAARRPSACSSTGRKRGPAPAAAHTATSTSTPASTSTPTATSTPATTSAAPTTSAAAPAPAPPPSTTTNPATDATPAAAAPAPPVVGRLRFGVYPWGGVGCVEQCAPAIPENADRSMAMVKQLKGSRSFVVHVYGHYDGVSNASADSLLGEATWWSSNGLKVAAVLRYRPADAGKAAGYGAWVRTQTRRLAALTGTISIQIANEPNNQAPNAGDGSYPGVINAIATAVPAARAEVVAANRPEILIGFNWAAGETPTTTEPMWAALKQAGGSAFTEAVGFVGVNVYPGTWSPPIATSAITAAQVGETMRSTLDAARNKHLPAAGVGGATLVIGETGYPTTAARSPETQDMVLQAIVGVAESTKAIFGVTGVYWFSLRDGNTASGQLENGYGLLRDDYTPKPAFTTLQGLVASIGA